MQTPCVSRLRFIQQSMSAMYLPPFQEEFGDIADQIALVILLDG